MGNGWPGSESHHRNLAERSIKFRGYESRQLKTSVGNVHVIDTQGRGSLPPTVLLHGLNAASFHYLPLIYLLRRTAERIIAPDLPAHGLSDVPAGGTTGATLRAGLFEVLDRLLDKPAVIFGNSMGGLAAIIYALERPEKVRALVLSSPAGAAMAKDELDAFRRTFFIDDARAALAFIDRLFTQRSRLRPLLAWGVLQGFRRPAVRELVASFQTVDTLRAEQLSSLKPPTLLLWGRKEKIFPADHLEYFRRHLPRGARVEDPESFGHSPHLELPSEVAHRIVDFVSSLEGRKAESSTPPGNRIRLAVAHAARLAGARK